MLRTGRKRTVVAMTTLPGGSASVKYSLLRTVLLSPDHFPKSPFTGHLSTTKLVATPDPCLKHCITSKSKHSFPLAPKVSLS